MQASEDRDPEQLQWIQYPLDRHTKLDNEIPIMHPHVNIRASVRAHVHTFPVDKDHPIVARWNEVASQVIKNLSMAGLQWVTVECFNRRQLDEESNMRDNTTIVITLSQLSARTKSLDDVLEEIHKLSGGLWVELLQGQISLHGTHEASGIEIPYAQKPPMGSSIGLLNTSKDTGTLGGFIELFKEGLPAVSCGLTCNHVVRPGEDHTPPEADFYPIKPDNDKQPPILIGHPSLSDHESIISSQKKVLKLFRGNEEKCISKLLVDAENSRTQKALESTQVQIADCERNITLVQTADREIGQVFAASGYTLAEREQCRFDWGLISLHPERVGVNKFTVYPRNTICVTSWHDDIQQGAPVFKIGSTSLYTAGYVNHVESFVAYKGTSHEMVSKEWVIVSGERCPFGDSGDSGAFVLDLDKQVIGLYWGSKKTRLPMCTHTFYFTPIKAVIDHIEEVTGYQVRFPTIDQTEVEVEKH